MIQMLSFIEFINEQNHNKISVNKFFKKPPVGFVVGLKNVRNHVIEAELDLSILEPTQFEVDMNFVEKYAKNPPSELPLVVKYDNRLFVVNHTRIAAQVYNNKTKIKVVLTEYKNGRFQKPK